MLRSLASSPTMNEEGRGGASSSASLRSPSWCHERNSSETSESTSSDLSRDPATRAMQSRTFSPKIWLQAISLLRSMQATVALAGTLCEPIDLTNLSLTLTCSEAVDSNIHGTVEISIWQSCFRCYSCWRKSVRENADEAMWGHS